MLTAGTARETISPPGGVYLVGYAERTGGNLGVRDDLYATALALSDGGRPVVVVSCDLLCINEFTADRIREAAGPGLDLFISGSHTHSGPMTCSAPHSPRTYEMYAGFLVGRVAAAVRHACESLSPARLEWVASESDMAVNRRERGPDGKIVIGWNRGGPVDRSLQALVVSRAEGGPMAVIVNHACHGAVLPPGNRLVSSDWIGPMRKRLESETGAKVLFLQGATGDLNPDYEWGEGDPWEAAESLGTRVADRLLEALRGPREAVNGGPVRAVFKDAWLPLEAAADSKRPNPVYRKRVLEFAGLPGWLGFVTDFILDRRYPWLPRIDEKAGVWSVPLKVSAVRIGDVAIAGLGAEVFTEIGIRVKGLSPAGRTLFASLAGGCIGYLPTDAAHDEGGYEVDQVPYLYRYPGRLARGCEGIAVEAVQAGLRSLFDGS